MCSSTSQGNQTPPPMFSPRQWLFPHPSSTCMSQTFFLLWPSGWKSQPKENLSNLLVASGGFSPRVHRPVCLGRLSHSKCVENKVSHFMNRKTKKDYRKGWGKEYTKEVENTNDLSAVTSSSRIPPWTLPSKAVIEWPHLQMNPLVRWEITRFGHLWKSRRSPPRTAWHAVVIC